MFRMKSFLAAPALALFLGGTAHAALTADQVWQSWKDAGTKLGLEVTAATESNANGVLTLNGVSIAPAGIKGGITISNMVLTEEADGSVSIAPGADVGVMMQDGVEASAKIVHDGLVVKVREAQGGLAYDYTAAKLDISYDSKIFDPDKVGAPPIFYGSGTISGTNLSGSYSDTTLSNRVFGLDLKADTLGYRMTSEESGMWSGQDSNETTGLELSVDFTLPSKISLFAIKTAADFKTALTEGLALSLTTKQAGATGAVTEENPYFPVSYTVKTGSGDGAVSFNKDKFELRANLASFEVESGPGMMPAPVKVTSGPVQASVLVPIIATAPADYGFLLKFNQISINDEAWALFDPAKALKRDAADLAVDISGKVSGDMIGLMAAEETGTMPPTPKLESLNITELSAKVAGAALAATGAFTFDNTTPTPVPLGEANVKVTGANQLIQGLIAAGLWSQEEAMGMQMMMGMYMVPGANPDELTSKIEAKEGYRILVNGQEIPM